jgi:hypothetical protein
MPRPKAPPKDDVMAWGDGTRSFGMTAAIVDLGAREAPEGTSCPASAVKETSAPPARHQGATTLAAQAVLAAQEKCARRRAIRIRCSMHPNEATRAATNSRVRARAKWTGLWFIAC